MGQAIEQILVNSRYRQLDSLRGLAALCVLFCHYQLIFLTEATWVTYLKISPFGVLVNGRSAVMFFFVLSGFVLCLPFVNNEKPLKLTSFYVKRIFRIYPAYLFALFFALVLKTFIYDKHAMHSFSEWVTGFWQWDWNKGSYKELFKSMLLIGPRFDGQYFDPVIWTLIVEMQMSLVLPFFIIIASRTNLIFDTFFLLAVVWLIYYNDSHYLGIFYIGILCAKYKNQLVSKVKLWCVPSIVGILLFGVFLYNIHFEFFTAYSNANAYYNLQFFVKDYITAFGAGIFLIVAISRARVAELFQNRFFTFVGDISYSFYLLHLPILITLCSLFSSRYKFSNLYILISSILATSIISIITYKFIEKPFQEQGKKLIERRRLFRTLNLRA